MSGKIHIEFNVTNMLLMQETLKRLKHDYKEIKDGLSISRNYYDIEIYQDRITGDSMNRSEIEKIKAEYQRDFQLSERSIRGEIYEVTETNNEIVILVQ